MGREVTTAMRRQNSAPGAPTTTTKLVRGIGATAVSLVLLLRMRRLSRRTPSTVVVQAMTAQVHPTDPSGELRSIAREIERVDQALTGEFVRLLSEWSTDALLEYRHELTTKRDVLTREPEIRGQQITETIIDDPLLR